MFSLFSSLNIHLQLSLSKAIAYRVVTYRRFPFHIRPIFHRTNSSILIDWLQASMEEKVMEQKNSSTSFLSFHSLSFLFQLLLTSILLILIATITPFPQEMDCIYLHCHLSNITILAKKTSNRILYPFHSLYCKNSHF